MLLLAPTIKVLCKTLHTINVPLNTLEIEEKYVYLSLK
jgi:hypothetical protein